VPRVALATAAHLPALDEDGPLLRAALAATGVEAEVAVWDDGTVDWSRYDLVVVRSTWDYSARREEFLAWAAGIPRLANPAPVLAWNTDKAYLRELAAAGVPVVPTTWLVPGDEVAAPAVEHVVKPTVSAGARDTARYGPDESAASAAHARRLLEAGRPVMVQPYLSGVDTAGETAVLCFEGEVDHGARKGALLAAGAGVDNTLDSRAAVTPRVPTAAEVEVARAALAAVPWPAPLLYARVDLVPGPDGTPVVIELEVAEPSLFLRHAPGSAQRFAAAVRRAALSPGT